MPATGGPTRTVAPRSAAAIPTHDSSEGNRAAGAPRIALQRKLTVGAVNDPLEHEADRVADQVVRMPEPSAATIQRRCLGTAAARTPLNAPLQINRKCAVCEAEEKLQKKRARSTDQILKQEEPRYFQTDPDAPANQSAIGGFFFCDPPLYDADQIGRALETAKLWVATAILRLDQLTTGSQTVEEETAARLALRDNFHITETHPGVTLLPKTPLETVLDNFITIQGALNQTLQFYCTSGCLPGELAWVLPNPQKLQLPPGIITMCSAFFGCDPLKQASTIIHERAHEALKAQDYAYEVSSKYDSLPTTMALENAESYGVAARQVYYGGIHGPGISCRGTSGIRPFEFLELTPPSPKAPSRTRLPRGS